MSPDRREEARNPARLEVRITAEGGSGTGVLTDLSYSGARLEDCSWVPPADSVADVHLEIPGLGSHALTGTVKRYGPSSFALSCTAQNVSDRERVDRVTAMLFAASTKPD